MYGILMSIAQNYAATIKPEIDLLLSKNDMKSYESSSNFSAILIYISNKRFWYNDKMRLLFTHALIELNCTPEKMANTFVKQIYEKAFRWPERSVSRSNGEKDAKNLCAKFSVCVDVCVTRCMYVLVYECFAGNQLYPHWRSDSIRTRWMAYVYAQSLQCFVYMCICASGRMLLLLFHCCDIITFLQTNKKSFYKTFT